MQSRQALFCLVVAVVALVQVSLAAPIAFAEESQEAPALSQAGGLKLVAVEGKNQAANPTDNLPTSQQPKAAGVDSASAKDKTAEQAGSPQQLVETDGKQEQTTTNPKETSLENETRQNQALSHQKRTESSDTPSAETQILKAKPDEHQEGSHEQSEMNIKESSTGVKSKPPSQQDSPEGAKESSTTAEPKDEHGPVRISEVKEQDTPANKDTNHLTVRSATEDKETKDPHAVSPTKSSETQTSSHEADEKAQANAFHASGSEKQDSHEKDDSKILAQASGSEEKQDSQGKKDDSKSPANASGSESKQEANPKDDAKILVEVPDHASASEDKESLHKRNADSAGSQDKQSPAEKTGGQSFAAVSTPAADSSDKESQAVEAKAHLTTPSVSSFAASGKQDTQEEQAAAAAEHV